MSPISGQTSNSSIVAGKSTGAKKIGILALQGDVHLHAQVLEILGITAILVKMPSQLRHLDGLIIPGGESTALLRLCEPIGILAAITTFAKSGRAIFGTCAGAILLAAEAVNPAQQSLGLIAITVQRNGYGRQINSTEASGKAYLPLTKSKIPLVFIRAPRIMTTGKHVKTLVSYRNEPVLVQQGKILAATFHPELQADKTVYEYWLGLV
jgi:5'-phosphate synthase pdxT subunit